MRLIRLALALSIGFISSACTVRYSQSLTPNLPAPSGAQVRASDKGISLFAIVIDEPKPAHELVAGLMSGCKELTRVQVDYREVIWLIIGFPEVSVTGHCAK